MQQHTGIVLRRYMPKKQKISVLDAHLGRIEAVIRDERLLENIWPGMELVYVPVEAMGVYVLDQATLIAAPFISARFDIDFLHHILELSYYFLELHDVNSDMFSLVKFACSGDHALSSDQKIMVVAKFLWQLRQEIDMLQDKKEAQRLLGLPLKGMLNETVGTDVRAHLFSWIQYAISCHPQRTYFKTIGFIKGKLAFHEV